MRAQLPVECLLAWTKSHLIAVSSLAFFVAVRVVRSLDYFETLSETVLLCFLYAAWMKVSIRMYLRK